MIVPLPRLSSEFRCSTTKRAPISSSKRTMTALALIGNLGTLPGRVTAEDTHLEPPIPIL